MTDPKIHDFLNENSKYRPAQYAVLMTVRSAILDLHPTIAEQFKFGGILFGAPKQFCGLFSYANHVSLEFSEGVAIPDEGNVLEGAGKHRRHIKLFTIEGIDRQHVFRFLELALNQCKILIA